MALATENCPAAVAALLGIIKAGGVATPLNLTVTDTALGAMIDDCDPHTVLASAAQAARLEPFVGRHRRIALGTAAGWRDFHSWVAESPPTAPHVDVGDDDPINIIYSSGTTGRPKGIVHTHRRRLGWAEDLAVALRYHGAARTLCTLPLYSNISWVMPGQNIYPADIEAVLIRHPDVSDAAVIGVPSERWGETPLAVVEATAGCRPDPDALMQWLNERVGRFQRVSGVELTDELPRNPNGKVLKRVLRERNT